MLDIAIIGAGPAGLSAAINGVTRNKRVMVFGNKPTSSLIYKAEQVNNYLGMYGVTGKEMIEQYVDHAKSMGVPMHIGKVIQIFSLGDYYTLNVENEFFEARTVIIATGLPMVKMLPKEEEFIGKGISYCATCDGMLYKDKDVVVFGETHEAEKDVNYLSEICRNVHYVHQYKDVKHINHTVNSIHGKPKEIIAGDYVEGLKLKDQELKGNAVFLLRETTPVSKLISGLEMNGKTIQVNRHMETNISGIYAAGDCTGTPYQISKAVGEGLIAALSAVTYIDRQKAA
ncbi:NAD(P)/FAD-dependent oxidoreductase [Vallitalea pronyensis]|uniref:NAD(P)/FAD-dependent oxidoreductase n=1 Tax=Vallitalea pronyensis TaxID=1348613 RepID=A0A8J8MLE8_9FIRM|nr:NAD(P)/FAD-dependent oxidoreductase [Vallitalea pronyensis]QUI23408.1 NAD(P)/FAD-dependent oxidoreductase [Vallitalea pronyensis]